MLIGIIISILLFFCLLFSLSIYKLQRMPAIPVLKYHRIDNNIPDEITISPELFEKQLIKLKKMGYKSITLQEFDDMIYKKRVIHGNPVVITFDDGFFDNYKFAFLILKKHNMKATIFLTTSLIKDKNTDQKVSFDPFKDAYLKNDCSGFLNWNQVKEMHNSGIIDFQPHTHYHKHRFENSTETAKVEDPYKLNFKTLSCFDENIHIADPIFRSGASIVTKAYDPKNNSTETNQEYLTRITKEIKDSKDTIENKLNKKCSYLAWPWGLFNKYSIKIAKKLGINLFLTTFYGSNHYFTQKTKIKRFTPDNDIDKFSEEMLRNSFTLSSLCIDNKLYNLFSKKFIQKKLKEILKNG